jgi:alanine racemase
VPLGSSIPQFSNKPIAYIHLDNIQANLNLAREKSRGCKTMAVVKANAYGHGVEFVAKHLTGMDAFAVARVEEGVALRSSGIGIPIYVLQGFLGKAELEICINSHLIPMIHSVDQWQLVNSLGVELPVWLKFDTGMHRLGLNELELDMILANPGGLVIIGIASHFANADVADHDENLRQLRVFNSKTNNLSIAKSMANSGAVLGLKSSHYDWVRPGIMLYGGSTSIEHDPTLKPGMTLTAPIIAVRSLAAGESIGYGSVWATEVATRIAVVGIGYADGYPRELPPRTPVLINGKRCEIVGRVSMDMIMVEIPLELQASSGDRAILWGDTLFIDDVASHIGTLGYTLMSGLSGRVERIASSMTPAELVAGIAW